MKVHDKYIEANKKSQEADRGTQKTIFKWRNRRERSKKRGRKPHRPLQHYKENCKKI